MTGRLLDWIGKERHSIRKQNNTQTFHGPGPGHLTDHTAHTQTKHTQTKHTHTPLTLSETL